MKKIKKKSWPDNTRILINYVILVLVVIGCFVELYRAASTTTKKEAMEVLKSDAKPNDSLLEAVLSNKEVKKVLTDMIKTGLKK